MHMLKSIAAAAALAGMSAITHGAVSLTTSSYAQNFDSLAQSGTPTWTNNVTVPGWEAMNVAGGTPPTYQAGSGTLATGSLWSFGVEGINGVGDRALGSIGSSGSYWGSPGTGSNAGYYGVVFTNDTGGTITSFTVTYDMEQWRNGGNTAVQALDMQWATNITNWFGTFNAGPSTNSPITGSTAAALDGNAAANRVDEVSFTHAVTIAPGEMLWIRFREFNDLSNDHGLAIDDFRLSVVVPEPASLSALGLGAVGLLARRRARAVPLV